MCFAADQVSGVGPAAGPKKRPVQSKNKLKIHLDRIDEINRIFLI
jgi:hypothetical protein